MHWVMKPRHVFCNLTYVVMSIIYRTFVEMSEGGQTLAGHGRKRI